MTLARNYQCEISAILRLAFMFMQPGFDGENTKNKIKNNLYFY